jgi:hypothetical protein
MDGFVQDHKYDDKAPMRIFYTAKDQHFDIIEEIQPMVESCAKLVDQQDEVSSNTIEKIIPFKKSVSLGKNIIIVNAGIENWKEI